MKYATALSAGLDLELAEDIELTPQAIVKAKTTLTGKELSSKLDDQPIPICGLVCPRSGLALDGITIVNAPGIIDRDYDGDICVILQNVKGFTRFFKKGDRIAQLLLVPYVTGNFEVDKIKREDKGFGSTGV